MGATDVVPFVPISGVSMQDCVAIANRLGKRVGESWVSRYISTSKLPGDRIAKTWKISAGANMKVLGKRSPPTPNVPRIMVRNGSVLPAQPSLGRAILWLLSTSI